MTQPDPTPAPRPSTPDLRGFARWARAWLAAPDRGHARWLLAGVVLLTLVQVAIQIRFNTWNRDFFNALEHRDAAAFRTQIQVFLLLAAASMSAAVYQLYLKQLLQLGWREWLTGRLTEAWMREARHYQLEAGAAEADNPDQRIAEDVRVATELAIEFSVGLLISVSTLVAFVGILWALSGPLAVTLAGHAVEVPGYMVWAAVLYAALGSAATWLVGRPMVGINVRRTTAEADFRFGLTRARESGESIALIRGEPDERRGLGLLFGRVREAMHALMRSQRNLMWLTSAYGTLAMIFPTVVAAPAYFAGAMSLGVLMQVGAAFGQVQAALNWFVDSFPRIAEWRGAVARLVAFQDALDDLDAIAADPAQPTIVIEEGAAEALELDALEIAFADGTTVIAGASAVVAPGERVLIKGESGTGKSTLFRAIGGLWPWGGGRIATPPRAAMAFLPQRPYLPLGTLAGVTCYPRPAEDFDPAEVQAALGKVGLEALADRLEEEERWDRVLSLGEQQRLAFARLLLHRPRWIFMDEATSALDEANQDAMMTLVIEELPEAAVISIGHRPGLEAFHTRSLTLVKSAEGARFQRLPPRAVSERALERRRRVAA
ncbi:ABC transporter ATP-binding protein/permease [Neoroseomonas oryzicola]|uniref:ABC transporter ATP-binding protein/permease n=1 Tax=Neoroseomonas oryzicola TaxID=535904 RepID=A0A9X9WDH5_9PROT|nr:ABC transporter ATP-binding protein/permease [Neoroseomonas oryzicola]MBR0658385.1 ABC transporter ATP-binding protein/permease [Neoroseomonas oryzicola]NKE18550.1 ABC transporter ATP-binding protein/permease [Neoroseomonas oryzicola]